MLPAASCSAAADTSLSRVLRVRVECLRDCGGGEGVRRRVSREDDLGSGAAPRLEAYFEFDSDAVVLAGVVLPEGFCLDALPPAILLVLPLVIELSLGVLPVDPFVECLVLRFGFRLDGSAGMGVELLIRPDLRRPFSVYDVGPSASIFFHGGEMGFSLRTAGGGGVAFRVLCLFAGRSLSSRRASSMASACCSTWPFA